MKSSFRHKFRIDNIPSILKFPLFCYGYLAGSVIYSYFCAVRWTSSVKFIGKENINQNQNYIFAFWHSDHNCYFSVFLRHKNQVFMQHPFWYMVPVHAYLHLAGAEKNILGSTGNHGKSAADEVVKWVKLGYSTVFSPDGPNGPAYQLKKGILHISKQSNTAIVPLQFKFSRFIELDTWDQKKMPLPFSEIEVVIGQPIQVTEDNFSHIGREISQALG